jgi:hypothetical protein
MNREQWQKKQGRYVECRKITSMANGTGPNSWTKALSVAAGQDVMRGAEDIQENSDAPIGQCHDSLPENTHRP